MVSRIDAFLKLFNTYFVYEIDLKIKYETLNNTNSKNLSLTNYKLYMEE